MKECDKTEAKVLAAKDMRIPLEDTQLLKSSKYFFVFGEKGDVIYSEWVRIFDKKDLLKCGGSALYV